jgi:hypothetical protein
MTSLCLGTVVHPYRLGDHIYWVADQFSKSSQTESFVGASMRTSNSICCERIPVIFLGFRTPGPSFRPQTPPPRTTAKQLRAAASKARLLAPPLLFRGHLCVSTSVLRVG